MGVHFTNRRVIDGLEEDAEPEAVWLRPDMFTAIERQQLVAALADYGLEATRRLFARSMRTSTVAETRIEWWDVVDDAGAPAYQVWLYGVDCGSVLRHGTTDKVGRLCQFGWDEGDAALASALVTAHREIKQQGLACMLAKFDFAPAD
jgi:hypothetical protein